MIGLLINDFLIILVKILMKLLDNLLEIINKRGRQCIPPLFNMSFECENEQPTRNILRINFMRITKVKKTKDVLKNGCFFLVIKFKI